MRIRINKLLISVLTVSAVNAVCVLIMENVIGSACAEVIVSTVISLLWLSYAAVFCINGADPESKES